MPHCGLIVLYRAGPGRYFVSQQTLQPMPDHYTDEQFTEACNKL